MTPAWARALERRLARLCFGRLEVRGPGYRACFEGARAGPRGAIEVLRPAECLARLAFSGALGLGEGYLGQAWTSPDLFALLECLALNQAAVAGAPRTSPGRTLARLRHLLRSNSRRGARRNIEAHYDLGNDFYRLWLDESLTYSCAFFGGAELTLVRAQREKYRRALERLDARPGERVLEIGCGWGGLALEGLARGLDWTGISLSPAQLETASRRTQSAVREGRARFELRDFRDVAGSYDHAVSIEMIEAVGERLWPAFFATVAAALRPGGRLALQAIVIHPDYFERYRRGADFVQRYVFPGGMLPTVAALRAAAQSAGLAIEDERFYAPDYARTLAIWDRNVGAREPEIRALGFDARFVRLWHYYLAYCAAGFRSGRIDLLQATVLSG